MPQKLVKLELTVTCVGEHLFEKFLIHNYQKQGNALLPLFFTCALECAIRKFQENKRVKMSGKC